ncbi:MAG: NYN domain-containing protein [Synechococcus sp.]
MAATVLIVDGYNAIHAWPSLKKYATKSELHIARSRLLERLSNFVVFKGYSGMVVFDAHKHRQPSVPMLAPKGLDVHFSEYGETADTVIERTCAHLQWEDCRVRVATSDRSIQLVAMGFDADWVSVLGLFEEVKHAAKQAKRAARSTRKPGRGIDGFLDEGTRDRLMQWRLNGKDVGA